MGITGDWHQEVEDLVRGMTGGLLIGTPLLYTMESWTIGSLQPPQGVLVWLLIVFALNVACVYWIGFRQGSAGLMHTLTDAVEATALAIVITSAVLVLLGRVTLDQSIGVSLGQIMINSIPVSLGIAIANYLVSRNDSRADPAEGEGTDREGDEADGRRATLLDLGATAAGALFFSFSIALTDEVTVLTNELPVLYLPIMILFSLIVTYGIVFVADFTGQGRRRETAGLLQHPVTETVAAYLISLGVAAAALWLFGVIDTGTAPMLIYTQVIVLGLPAAIGGAAGRLAV